MIPYSLFRRRRRQPQPIGELAKVAVTELSHRARAPHLGAYHLEATAEGGAIVTLIEEEGIQEISVPPDCALRLTQAHARRTARHELAKAIDYTPYLMHCQPVSARNHYDDSCGGWAEHG